MLPSYCHFPASGPGLRRLARLLMLLLALAAPALLRAHPVPNSVVLLDIHPQHVEAEIQLPIPDLQYAFGQVLGRHPETIVERYGPELRTYLRKHVRPRSPDGRPWTVRVGELRLRQAAQTDTGPYQEVVARLQLLPPPGASPRTFTFDYDAIVHQVVTHVILVAVRQDWETGRLSEQPPTQVGVIRLSPRDNRIPPLEINEARGSLWTGLRSMVALGTQHIAAGTDHLLFLLALLLPAPLLAAGRRWGGFGGVRYSLRRLLRIVTAFTLGHSLTLLAGALGWLRLPGGPVEALIAVSILVSAAHAWRPLFPGREGWVAAGFGLIHGLAFAGTLADLQLDAGRLALSILGFNLGIEVMQLFVIGLTVPWLLLLSRSPRAYAGLRLGGAAFAGVAALAWLAERLMGRPNAVTGLVERVADYAPGLLAGLALAALVSAWARWHNRSALTD
jgi:hypothetical protein